MERVTGIGGVFLRARDPAVLATWYAAHLGIDVGDWSGAAFRSAGGETLVWAAFPADTGYFGRLYQQVMVNYRVGDLDALITQLRVAGIPVDGPEETENGRFGWATDPEGNRFELWQPPAGS
jgi:predicted enzyme related to lactoylglutathione lyase